MLSKKLSVVCRIFPIRYQRSDNPSVTETVCIVTLKPPKAKKQERIKKRIASDVNAARLQQPFDNSSRPVNTQRSSVGNSHRNHLSQKQIRIRNSITQPQIDAITRRV